MSTQITHVRVGSSLTTLLTVLFVALKLLGKITWSWWWVLAPTWLPAALLLVIVVLVGASMLLD